jgi:hypothetical protein
MTTKRGFSYAEAIAYVGVGRRTFDERWRPHLVAIPQGSYLIFDRGDLDRLFDEFKRQAAGEDQAANDADQAQNAPRNGRPTTEKGTTQWAKERGVSTPVKTVPGKSTSGGEGPDFASAALLVTRRPKAG